MKTYVRAWCLAEFFSAREMFQKKNYRENQKKNSCSITSPPKIMPSVKCEKKVVETDRSRMTIWRMRIT
jgi:hypothetical protein